MQTFSKHATIVLCVVSQDAEPSSSLEEIKIAYLEL